MLKTIEEIPCETASEFLGKIRMSHEDWWDDLSASRQWIFRGHADANWDLIPTAWRSDSSNKLLQVIEHLKKTPNTEKEQSRTYPSDSPHHKLACCWVYAECMALNQFRKCASEIGFDVGEWTEGLDPEELLLAIPSIGRFSTKILAGPDIGIAQHYGVPTRFLDWTFKPYIAAFFASVPDDVGRKSVLGNRVARENGDPEKLAVWALNVNPLRPYPLLDGPNNHNKVRCHIPKRFGNEFIRAQDGLLLELPPVASVTYFLEHGRWPTVVDWIETSYGQPLSGPILKKFTLPYSKKAELYDLLLAERLRYEVLMPTLENAAEASLREVLGCTKAPVLHENFASIYDMLMEDPAQDLENG